MTLHHQKVPDFNSPHCECGYHCETALHTLLHCPCFRDQHQALIHARQIDKNWLLNTTQGAGYNKAFCNSSPWQSSWLPTLLMVSYLVVSIFLSHTLSLLSFVCCMAALLAAQHLVPVVP